MRLSLAPLSFSPSPLHIGFRCPPDVPFGLLGFEAFAAFWVEGQGRVPIEGSAAGCGLAQKLRKRPPVLATGGTVLCTPY